MLFRSPAQGNGSTLALRLARDLTETMGGTLSCDQPSEGGRSVSLALPAAGTRSIPAAIGPDDQLAGANARTLADSATRG